MASAEWLLEPLLALHDRVRSAVLDACERQAAEQLAAVASQQAADTIYAIDRVSDELLEDGLSGAARREPLLLLAEGLPEGGVPLPRGTLASDCRWRVLIDPIDGTRGLMYQKRSAWILTAVAPNNGAATRLRDAVFAVQTEIPLLKQYLSDQLWAWRGGRVEARRWNRLTKAVAPLALQPSRASSLAHGFATIVRFFPGAGELFGALDDAVLPALVPPEPGKAGSFEDQYASTGGQLYELLAGHDRLIADLRPLAQPARAAAGQPPLLCCHPYDLCTALIAERCGVVLTGADGSPLDAPFDVTSDVAWIGYANAALRAAVEPVLQQALARRGMLPCRQS